MKIQSMEQIAECEDKYELTQFVVQCIGVREKLNEQIAQLDAQHNHVITAEKMAKKRLTKLRSES